jgi:hypothetical protein
MDDSIDSKSKQLCSTNIYIDNIDNEINDPQLTIPITQSILNTMIYNLIISFNHAIDQTKHHNF